MKGPPPTPESPLRLSPPSSPVCLALVAALGFDLCAAAPRIKPTIVPGFHAGAWEAVEGNCPPPLQKYSHILHLCMIYLLS